MITIYIPNLPANSYIAVNHENSTRTISVPDLLQLVAVGTDPGFVYDEN